MKKVSLSALLILLINSAYLFSFGEPTLFYIFNVLLHVGLGIALILPFSIYAYKQFRRISTLGRIGIIGITVGIISGGYLMVVGATTPYRWLLITHIITVGVGSLLFSVHLLRDGDLLTPSLRKVGIVVLVGIVLFPLGARLTQHYLPNETYLVENPALPPTSMYEEGGGTTGHFFPASVETETGALIPTDFFLTSETCAAKGCHPDIYRQWNESAHHFSSFNNQWYRKSIIYMQEVNGIQPSKWCGGCHDPAILLNGVMDRPIRENLHTPAAQAGLACTACHSIEKVKDTMGNSGYVIKYPPLHDIAASDNPIIRNLHNYLIRLDPEPHKKSFLKPFHRQNTAEFCSTCHKVHLDEPVNNFRWIRGFNDYDQWQKSGVSHQGALSFYYPEKAKKCVDCHMPLVYSKDAGNINGKVHNHRFPAANTALPFVNQHPDQLKTVTEFLQNEAVTLDFFADGAPIPSGGIAVTPGESMRVDVVVRTRNVGHRFPAGTIDAFDIWLELKATDENGKIVFWNGRITAPDGNGPVDPGAHFYRAYMLDEHGNLINKRNAWATRTILYSNTIPPGAADTVRYRLEIPPDAGKVLMLEAKLNYRKFNWWHTQWAYAGVRDPEDTDFQIDKGYDDGRWVWTGDTSDVAGKIKAIPNLPIIVMASEKATLKVSVGGNSDSRPIDVSVGGNSDSRPIDDNARERWNDYGIGLLLQGDLKAAQIAFSKVTEIDPVYLDGWVNIARCRIEEGNMQGAEAMLEKAFEIQKTLPPENPHRAKVHYFYALVQETYGNYDIAIEHLQRAAAQFPRDTRVRNKLGRMYFLKRNYETALTEFQKTLTVDPEDLDAHYNMMRCYRALKNPSLAAKSQKLYLRFKADESVDAITGIPRRADPNVNRERQRIHEHTNSYESLSNP
ncbi:MAG: tetratricopeptide repeat protein [Candidatus Poribacteria bacterium]|nr:tetratricopeptide repeat protein [Candidatus Poribacteria bacterium]